MGGKQTKVSSIVDTAGATTSQTIMPGMNVSQRTRSVALMADPANEHAYTAQPVVVVVEHGAEEDLGVTLFQVGAAELPGLSSVVEEKLEVAIVLKVAPEGAVARFNAQHGGLPGVGSVILQREELSKTSTRLTVGRWGYSVVVERRGVEPYLYPGAEIEAHHSLARISRIYKNGAVWKLQRMTRLVKEGDFLVAVNGVPVVKWVWEGGWLSKHLWTAGEPQEWVVVRMPRGRAELLRKPSSGSDTASTAMSSCGSSADWPESILGDVEASAQF